MSPWRVERMACVIGDQSSKAWGRLRWRECRAKRTLKSPEILAEDERVFAVVGIIARAKAGANESEFFIKPYGGIVSHTNLEEYRLGTKLVQALDQLREQRAREALPTRLGPHAQGQDFGLARYDAGKDITQRSSLGSFGRLGQESQPDHPGGRSITRLRDVGKLGQ